MAIPRPPGVDFGNSFLRFRQQARGREQTTFCAKFGEKIKVAFTIS
jgi:hypothetical protein